MRFPKSFYTHLEQHNYTEIKGGVERETFLEIWVVAVAGRVFARSWNKSARSWFTEIAKTGRGQLKHGDSIYPIWGKKLAEHDNIHRQIDNAYLKIYHQKENIYYAQGISQPEYAAYTMEFFFDIDPTP